jgi:hypothetical protein
MTRGRLIAILVVVVAIAAGVAWYLKRPASTPARVGTASGTGTTTTTTGVADGTAGSSGEDPDDGAATDAKYRVIDADSRMALMERIQRARAARLAGKPATGAAVGGVDDPAPLPGELTPDEVLAGIMPVMPLFKDCYEQGLERRTVKNGEVKFTMHLAGEPGVGTLVETAELDGDPAFLADAELSQCLHETMMSVELPPMSEGSALEFITTMRFADEPSEPSPDAR